MAEMLFKDTRFRCHSLVWVHTSRYLHEIGRSVICQVSGKEEMSHATEDDVDSITDLLHELLSGIKVLIVLDDLCMRTCAAQSSSKLPAAPRIVDPLIEKIWSGWHERLQSSARVYR